MANTYLTAKKSHFFNAYFKSCFYDPIKMTVTKHAPLRSPILWFGGKSRLAKTITGIIEQQPHTKYVETFAGSASVFFHKTPSQKEVINDINPTLMEFYHKMQKSAIPCFVSNTQKEFDTAKKNIESKSWNVCDFIRVNKDSFGGQMKTYASSNKCDPKKGTCYTKTYNQQYPLIQHRLKDVEIQNTDYEAMVKRHDSPQTLFYADPPYNVTSSKGYNTDLSRVSPDKIAEVFSKIKGKAIISFNDSPDVRASFKKYPQFHINPVSVNYSMNYRNQEKRNELLITNFSL